ncbi:MAG: 4Fe-4S binding protein [Desulfovibrionales bacterium]|nr:4Fe-4S binding protein [Desulfovibrionales bacterium]
MVILLVMISIYRWVMPVSLPQSQLQTLLPEGEKFQQLTQDPPVWVGKTQDQVVGYLALGQANGYGGPMSVATVMDAQGKIKKVSILAHRDTPAFINMLATQHYTDRFAGIQVPGAKASDFEVDGISGATYSSRGVAKGVGIGGRAVSSTVFGKTIPGVPERFNWGTVDAVVALLMGLMILGSVKKYRKLRWVTLGGGFILLGFYYSIPLSFSHLVSLCLGYFPDIHHSLAWYLLVPGVLLLCLAMGRNLYCYWLCPFGAFQELTAGMGGGKWRCRKSMDKSLGRIKSIVTVVCLVAGVILANPGVVGYEPFSLFFALQGEGIQWYILPVVVFASFFIHRFWCRYFCPVGVVLGVVAAYGRLIRRWRRGRKKEKALKKGGLK